MLREVGMELIVFRPIGDYQPYPGFRHIGCPFLLVEQGRLLAEHCASRRPTPEAALCSEMVAIDRAWGMSLPEAEAEYLVLCAIAFWKKAFAIMQPSVVLGWGSTLPFSRLMVRLAQRQQVPAYMMERGPLDNTLSLSLSGQIALSGINTSPALARPAPLEGRCLEAWNHIEEYYRSISDRRYPTHNISSSTEEQRFLAHDPRPRVLYLGTQDIGSGCALDHHALGERFGTWVKSSESAAQQTALALASVAPQASFWSKPHPGVQFTLPTDTSSQLVRNFSRVDIHTLVQAADVCVTIASGVQFLALVYDRPLVTLGNGFLMGRDIAYEATSAEQLGPMLRAALERRRWSERLERGRALIVSMMEHDMFGLNDLVPTRLKVADLALLLGRFAAYTPADAGPAEIRYEEFLAFRAEAEKQCSEIRIPQDPLLVELEQRGRQLAAAESEQIRLKEEQARLTEQFAEHKALHLVEVEQLHNQLAATESEQARLAQQLTEHKAILRSPLRLARATIRALVRRSSS
ncbi:MAG: hypothetical protein K8U03_16565 [Planctomycetia bacterium]|nr:hypothetical protein [Planctomycetia bacterium]